MLPFTHSRSVRPRGFTLIELTVVLAVIVTLALVLTPAITNFVSDARIARARSDTQTIASAVLQFYRDTGFFPMWSQAQAGGPGTAVNKVDLLISRGNVPAIAQPSPWTTGTAASLTDVLIYNTPVFAVRTGTTAFGWNGPYLSSIVEPDAWSNRYTVNVGLIDTTAGTLTAAGSMKNAVWVLCAGPNGAIDTPYAQPFTVAALAGDDIGIRLQ